ncbi:MAG: uroporphyrinogen-III C-methyltransferase [Planctomycetales bacterium]|nr:uroporphyrinogen-III C-methyltransferase [Planctomycetales bacterium]
MTREQLPMGKVYLVGAGPGDPGLITLRGAECLRRADVVLYDYLVNPRILKHARADAELSCLGKHGSTRLWTQHEINEAIVELAHAGRTVVRLKGGDPAVFARGAEEVETLVRHGIPFEIVPGITVALAAGSYCGIPITHRDLASAVALVTGQERHGKEASALDYESLARFPGTLVFYMGVTTVDEWTASLIAAGKDPATPAAIVRRCSWPDQRTIHCRLDEVAGRVAEERLRPPTIVLVGDVVNLGPAMSWFDKRPLFGRRVLVTRPDHQAEALASLLEEAGAETLVQPAIAIEPPDDWTEVDAALHRLGEFDWLVFSSANGVRYTLRRLADLGLDARALGGVRLATIGPGTTEALAEFHLRGDLQPNEYRAEALAEALAGDASGQRFLLARASRGREVLAETLRAAGGLVEQVVVYRSSDVTQPDEAICEQLDRGRIDWVTVTSSAIARATAAMFGDSLRRARLASISPITSETLEQLGFQVSCEATEYTMPGVVRAMVEAESQSDRH